MMQKIIDLLLGGVKLGALGVGLKSNWFELFTVELKDLKEVGHIKLLRLFQLLKLAIILPTFLLSVGCGIGYVGELLGWGWTEVVAQVFITPAAFICSILLLLFWVYSRVYVSVIIAGMRISAALANFASNVVEELTEQDFEDIDLDISEEEAEKFGSWLRGLIAFILIPAHLAACGLPIWRNLPVTMGIVICFIGIGMAAKWFDGKWFRIFAGTYFVGGILVGIAMLIVPAAVQANHMRTVENFLGYSDLEAAAKNSRDEDVLASKRSQQSLIDSRLAEREEIRSRGEEVGLPFASATDKARFHQLQGEIDTLATGKAWGLQEAPSKPIATTHTASKPSGLAALAPPPQHGQKKSATRRPAKTSRHAGKREVSAQQDSGRAKANAIFAKHGVK